MEADIIGRVVQVDPRLPLDLPSLVPALGKLNCDEPLLNFDYNLNMRLYIWASCHTCRAWTTL